MPLNSVYLVIHSQSLLENSRDKPYFRVVGTELPSLPARFTGHDYGNHKYTHVRVISSGTQLAEEWKVELEYDAQQDVGVVGWCNTLEAAAEKLKDSVLDDCTAPQQGTEKNGNRQTVRVTWTDSLDGNSTAFYRIKSTQNNFDGSTSQITTSHWYEIIRVNLEHDDSYDLKWHETARSSYLQTSERINSLSTKMRDQGLEESEMEELDGLRRGLGYLVVENNRYIRKSEEDGQGMREHLRNGVAQDRDSDSEDKGQKGKRHVDLDVNDDMIMGEGGLG